MVGANACLGKIKQVRARSAELKNNTYDNDMIY